MWRYTKKNGRSVFCFGLSNFLAAVSSVLLAYLLGAFTDAAMGGLQTGFLTLAVITLLYILLDTFLNFLMDYTKERAVHQIGKSLRSDVIRRIESLSNEEKRQNEDSYYLSLIHHDIPTVEQDYFGSLGAIYFQICCFGIAIFSAVRIQPIMTGIMLVISILPVMFPKLSEKPLQKAKTEEQEAKKTHLQIVTQILNGYSFLGSTKNTIRRTTSFSKRKNSSAR